MVFLCPFVLKLGGVTEQPDRRTYRQDRNAAY